MQIGTNLHPGQGHERHLYSCNDKTIYGLIKNWVDIGEVKQKWQWKFA